MDNILEKAIKFVFIPESFLSWVFIAIFAICFVYGILQYKKCCDRLEQFNGADYQKESGTLSPEQYVEDFDNKLSADDIKIIDLPNVFVSVGIIGTFLGLGVGLQGATDLLSSEKIDIHQLNEVLGVLAFKFQTSVWGTVFSLMFQKLVLERYYRIREDKLSIVKNNLFRYSMQWSMEQNLSDISNHLTEHCQGIAESYSRFVDVSGQFKDNVAQCIGLLEQYKNELVQSQHALSEYYDKHCEALDKFATKTDETAENICLAFKNSSENFVEKAGNELSQNMKDNLDTIHYEYMKETETINSTICELRGALEAFQNVSSQTVTNLTGALQKFEEVSEQLGENDKAMRENLSECKELLTSYSETINTAIGSVNTMAENVVQTGVSQQENLNKTLGDVVGQVTPFIEEISREHGQSVKKFADMQKTFNDFVNGWKNQETLQQRELKGIVQELEKKQGDKLSTIVSGVQKLSEKKGTNDGEKQLLKKLQEVISNQQMQLEEKKKLTKALELLSKQLDSIKPMEYKEITAGKQGR